MSPIVRRYVEAILTVAEEETDAELVQKFIQDVGASRKKAEEWVRHRELYRGGKTWHLGRDSR